MLGKALKTGTLDEGPDTDGDTISDSWELEKVAAAGMTTGTQAGDLALLDDATDTDSDGKSDYDEYLADTDPFDAANAKAPSRHKIQYFEMMGQWALYDDGWLLSTKVDRTPWDAFSPANPDPLNNRVFQLYNLNESWNQSDDVAAQHPDKVKEMRAMFLEEAKEYQVLPLDASVGARVASPRPSLIAGIKFPFFTVGSTDSDDTMIVWLPGQKVALNNVLWPYPPNIYTPRGSLWREPRAWRPGENLVGDGQVSRLLPLAAGGFH